MTNPHFTKTAALYRKFLFVLLIIVWCWVTVSPVKPVNALSGVSVVALTPFVTLDSNNSCGSGPRAQYIQATVTNNSGGTLSNLVATINFPTTAGGGSYTGNWSLDSGEITTRYIGTLANGAKANLYYFVNYPCENAGGQPAPITKNYSIVISNGIAPDVTQNLTLTTRYEISANAGGQLLSFDIGAGMVLGQIVKMTTIYSFGNVGSGNDLGLQPAGNVSFDSGCYQLVADDITAVNGVTGITTSDDNLLYKTGVSSGGTGNTITVDYYFKVVCANGVATTLNPWADMVSGTQEKYTGNFGACANTPCEFTTPDLPVNPFTLAKSVSPTSFSNGGTAQYTVTVTNSSNYTSFIDKIVDVLPSGVKFVSLINGASCPGTNEVSSSNSSSLPGVNAEGQIEFIGNIPNTTTLPPTGGYSIPANSSLSLCYTVTIPNIVGGYTNSATAKAGTVTIGPKTATVTVGTPPTVSKAFSPTTILNGGTSQLTITLANPNGSDLTVSTFVDNLPAGVTTTAAAPTTTCVGGVPSKTSTSVSLTGGTIPANGSCNVKVTVTSTAAGPHLNKILVGDLTTTQDFSNTTEATDTLTVYGLPAITVGKVANPTSVPETGGSVTFTYTVSNSGPVPVTITSLSDNKFGTLTGDSDCQVGTSLGVGASCTFDYSTSLSGAALATHTNIFTAHAVDALSNDASNTANANVNFSDVKPDITVTKTANPASVSETGGNVTFTYTVTNHAAETATITVLSDNKFGVLAGDADCQVGTVLAANGSCTFDATFAVPAGDYPGSHVNTFSATVNDGDGNTDTATGDATVTYTDVLPDITVTKTANPTSVPETGGNVTFTYTVINHSAESATITILNDNKFGSLVGNADCQVGTIIAANGSCTFDATFAVPAGNFGGSHVNTFSATVNDGDGNTDSATNNATVTYTDVLPNITVTKTANPTSVPETGGNVTFTYTVINHSAETATITALSDNKFGTLAGDADCKIGSVLTGNGSCTFDAMFAVPAGNYPGTHVNTFTATVIDGEGNTDTATGNATVTYTDVLPDITVTKTANPSSVPETGGNVTFTYSVTNLSSEDAVITLISDDKFGTLTGDADCQVGTVLSGSGSCTFDATFAVPAGDYPGSHVNTFTATVNDGDGNTDTATDDATVTYTDVLPDITVTKSANPTSVLETGGNVTFTYTVTNHSAESAAITILSDDKFGTLAGDSDCEVGTVIAGNGNCTFDASFAVPAGSSAATHVNTFTATVNDGDGNTDSATDDATVTYTDVLPDVSVTKTANPTSIPETGGSVTFTYTVENTSDVSVTITSLVDDKFGSLTGDADCKVSTVLASGSSCTFDYSTSLTGNALVDHVNTFTAHVEDADGNDASSSDDATVSFIDVLPEITVTKTANTTGVPETGGIVTFTYTVENTGDVSVTITSLADDKFTITGDSDCKVGTVLAVDESCTFDFSTNLSGPARDHHINTFEAHAEDVDGNDASSTDFADVEFLDVLPVISVTKTANLTSVPETGGNVTFTYTVENMSDVSVTITSLEDDKFGSLAGDADCKVGTELTGDSSCTFDYSTNLTGTVSVDHVNTFTAHVEDFDGNDANNTDDATVSFTDVLPEITVTKSANPTSVPETGGSVTFTYTVENTGDVSVDITSLDDDIFGTLAGDVDCKVGTTLASGGSCTFDYTTTLTGTESVDHVNLFTAHAEDVDGNDASNTDDATVSFIHRDSLPILMVTKSGPASAEIGQNVTFTFTVQHDSTSDGSPVYGPLSVEDDYAGTASYVSGDANSNNILESSETWIFSADYTSSLSDPNPLVNTVTVSGGTDGEGDLVADVTDTHSLDIQYEPQLKLTKSAVLDMTVVLPNDAPNAGDTITYTFEVENTGDVPVTDIVVTDPLLPSLVCEIASLDPSEKETCTATGNVYELTQSDLDAGERLNSAEAEGEFQGEYVGATDDENVPLAGHPDMVLKKTGVLDIDVSLPVGVANPGDVITYSFEVENTGNVTLSDITVTDPLLPSLSCTIAEIKVGEKKTCTATGNVYTLVQDDIDAGQVTNTATAATTYGVTALSSTAGNIKPLDRNPELTLEKSSLDSSFKVAGEVLAYQYLLTNTGNVTLYAPFSVVDNKALVTCPVSPTILAQGESITCTANYTVTSTDVAVGFVHNTARANAVDSERVLVLSNQDELTINKTTDDGGDDGGGETTSTEGLLFIPNTGFAPNVFTNVGVSTARYDNTEMILEIPSLNMKTTITGVPYEDGNYSIDWLGKQAGWLEGTAFPTAQGNSVLTGHVYMPNGKPGPFVYLKTLVWGQQIIVHSGGTDYVYEVRSVKRVKPEDVSVMGHKDYSWLTLITCQGYDEMEDTYRYRTVVQAVLVAAR
jgi:LPXTG-site transpeptidase (sortase) family protein